jgi:hypothetical protein
MKKKSVDYFKRMSIDPFHESNDMRADIIELAEKDIVHDIML